MTQGTWLATAGSALDELHARAAAGAPDGAWVAVGEQTAGRGSRGRTWHSPAGGLWMAVLLRGTGAPAGFELASLRAGLAVANVLDALAPAVRVRLKWPNDLIAGDRKLGGILVEARWQGERLLWAAIGLGLNVANPIPPDLVGRAATLCEFLPGATPAALAEPIATALAGVDLEASELDAVELARYARRDWLLGRQVQQPVAGTAVGVGPDGRLAVRTPDGRLHYLALGEVLPA